MKKEDLKKVTEMIVVYRKNNNISIREISKILGISTSTFISRLKNNEWKKSEIFMIYSLFENVNGAFSMLIEPPKADIYLVKTSQNKYITIEYNGEKWLIERSIEPIAWIQFPKF